MFTTVLSQTAKDALAILGKSGLVDRAYLAGGSALALHFGHRYSLDFDFFSEQPFNPNTLSLSLKKLGNFRKAFAEGISLIGTFQGVKMSYFHYEYPLIAPTTSCLHVNVAHPHDISAMKLAAIMDRGTKRDFIDVYELIRRGTTIDTILLYYDQKYKALNENLFSLIKSLRYFDDAEGTDMPDMITPVSWDEVKRFFISESMRLAHKHLGESTEES